MKHILVCITFWLVFSSAIGQGNPAVNSAGFAVPSVAVNGTTVLNIVVTNNDFVNFQTIPVGGYQVAISLPATFQYVSNPLSVAAISWISGPLFNNFTFDGVNVFTADLAAPQAPGDVSTLQIAIKGAILSASPVYSVVEVAPLIGGVASTDVSTDNSLQPYMSVVGVLPIKLISFSGSEKDCNTTLNWQSNNEVNFNHFELEFSNDGRQFSTIGNIKSQGLSTVSNYKFSYEQSGSIGFYRLKMVNDDGQVNYSNTIKILSKCKEASASIYPNPVIAMDGASLLLKNFGTKVYGYLYDGIGKQLQVIKLVNSTNKINLQNYAAGTYILKVFDENNNSAVLRINVVR